MLFSCIDMFWAIFLPTNSFRFEDDCFLGCCAVSSGRSSPTFQRCLPPPSSGRWVSRSNHSQTSVNFYQTTRRNIPEDSHFLLIVVFYKMYSISFRFLILHTSSIENNFYRVLVCLRTLVVCIIQELVWIYGKYLVTKNVRQDSRPPDARTPESEAGVLKTQPVQSKAEFLLHLILSF
jgi:hypothetical protein